jgi:putative membrane protein
MSALPDITPLIAGSNWDHGGFWWFPFSLLWIAVLVAAIWLLARTMRPGERRSGLERASDILAERYARGELSAEEYRARLEELRRPA